LIALTGNGSGGVPHRNRSQLVETVCLEPADGSGSLEWIHSDTFSTDRVDHGIGMVAVERVVAVVQPEIPKPLLGPDYESSQPVRQIRDILKRHDTPSL
jgi:hypothetical protein